MLADLGDECRVMAGGSALMLALRQRMLTPSQIISLARIDALRGMNISITTTAKTDDECKALLAGFRFPFKN